MSQLAFWQKNTFFPANSYVLDGVGNIQFTAGGGTSGANVPTWTTTTTPDNTVSWAWVGLGGKVIESQKPLQVGPLLNTSTDAISFSRGPDDAGKVILTNSDGQLDPSMGGGGGGGSTDFADLTTGTNTSAHMTVGGSAVLGFTGGGIVNANEIGNINVAGNAPSHVGQLLISQPGNATAVWADPLMQGLYPAGSSIGTPPAFATPTTIQPVLIGASDGTALQNLKVDGSSNLLVNVSNAVSVTGTVTVSGTVAATQSGSWNIGTVATITNPVTVTGTVAFSNSTIAVTNAGTFAVQVSNFPSTQPVSGTVAVSSVGGTVTVSGTVTANQGTSPWITQDAADGATGSSVPSKAIYVAGNHSGTLQAFTIDGSGNLNVNVAAGSSGNSAASATGSAVPADADYQGINVGGNLRGVTGFSVGSQFAEAVAIVDGSGNQITSFGGGTQYADGTTQTTPTGTVALGKNPSSVLHALALDSSGNLATVATQAGTWNIATVTTITNAVTVTGTVAATQSGTWNIGTVSTITNPVTVTGTVAATQSGSWTVAATQSGSWNIGTVATITNPVTVTGTVAATQSGSWTTTVTQATGTNLHTVVDSGSITVSGTVAFSNTTIAVTNAGTFAVQAAQSGTWNIGTVATITNPVTVVGNGTDNSTNSTTKVSTLPAVASSSAPSWTNGHQVPLSVDLAGNLRMSGGGGGGGNSAAGPTGSPVPADGDYIAFMDGSGNLVGVSSTNPLPVTGGGGGGSSVTLDVNATPLFTRALVNISSAGNSTIIAGVSTQIIRIYRMTLVIQTATTIAFQDTSSTNLFPATAVTASSTFSGEFDTQPKFTVASSAGFVINLSVGSVVTGFIDFTQS